MEKQITDQSVAERNPHMGDLLLIVNPINYVRDVAYLGRFGGYGNDDQERIMLTRNTILFNGSTDFREIGFIPTQHPVFGCIEGRAERVYHGPDEIRKAFLEDPLVKRLTTQKISKDVI